MVVRVYHHGMVIHFLLGLTEDGVCHTLIDKILGTVPEGDQIYFPSTSLTNDKDGVD